MQDFKNLVIFAIDNKSSDDSLAVCRRLADSSNYLTKIIPNEKNLGVAEGNNQGIRAALKEGCDYILLSNNDISMDGRAVRLLLEGLLETGSDMAVPKIFFYDTDILWAAGGDFNLLNGSIRHYGSEKHDSHRFSVRRRITYSPTCFMMIHASVFDDIGLMDHKYFVYYDDTDFIYRAMKAKKILYYIPESVIYHKVGISTGSNSDFTAYHLARNFVYFNLKCRRSYGWGYVLAKYAFHFLVRRFWLEKNRWKLILKGMDNGRKLYLESSRR